MNNHKPQNNEPRQDEPMFGYLLKRALLPPAQAGQEHRCSTAQINHPGNTGITIEHGSIRIGQER